MVQIEKSLAAGSVLRRNQDQAEFRILWMDGDEASYWIQLNKKGNIPVKFQVSSLSRQLADGEFIYVMDSYISEIRDDEISESDAKRRDRIWNIIRDAVTDEPDIYIPARRAAILHETADRNHISVKNLYPYLGRYWKGGKVPNALLPDYRMCGKSRDPYKEGAKAPGRKRKEGAVGKKLTHEDLRIFRLAVDKYFNVKEKPTLREAYRSMIRQWYRKKDAQGNPVDCEPNELPSYRQFQYWHSANRDPVKEKKTRNGEGNYERNYRGITEKTETNLFGPGEKVQIDATIGDVYLVRRDNRAQIAGRPTIYFIRDAKTHMVTGMYVSLDPPSWHSAGLALINMGENKVDYCKRYDIDITPEQWPCQNLPSVLLADRGEVESSFADKLANELGITIENTPPYRGDLKGIIERFFRLVDVSLGSTINGRVMPDMGERGAEDYRLKADLDIVQFTQILIHCVLFYNNKHYLSGYTRSFLMRQKGILPIPLSLWNFGIRYETGALRSVSREKIRYALLPQDTARITKYGITFHGLTYTCRMAEDEQWFSRTRITGSDIVTVSYDPRDAAFIYFRPSGFPVPVECHLLKHHEMYAGMQAAEVSASIEEEKAEAKKYEITELNARMALDDKIDEIKKQAARMAPDVSGMTKTERIGSIQENRRQERESMVEENTMRSLKAAGLIGEAGRKDAGEGRTEPSSDEAPHPSSALEKLLDDVASDIFQQGGTDK